MKAGMESQGQSTDSSETAPLATLSGADHASSSDAQPEYVGSYRIVRVVGEGGMGIVYEAWQDSLNRRVALKVLPSGLLAKPRMVARFQLEAQIASSMDHPGI